MFAASLAAMVLIAVAFTGCGKDSDNKGGGGANSVEWDPAKTVHPDQEGAAVLLVTGDTGTPWTAEIISGAEWISFNRTAPGGQTVKTGKVGTSLSDKNQYVYYWPNNTKDERHALIRFEFEGEMPVELELVQYSTSSNDNVYETGHNLVWPEIPAEKVNSNYIYVSHFAQLKNQNTNQWYKPVTIRCVSTKPSMPHGGWLIRCIVRIRGRDAWKHGRMIPRSQLNIRLI